METRPGKFDATQRWLARFVPGSELLVSAGAPDTTELIISATAPLTPAHLLHPYRLT